MGLNLVEIKAPNMKDVSLDLTNRVFQLCSQVVIEGFEDGALLLRLEDRHLFELNPTAYRLFVLTDGQRSVSHVFAGLAEAYQISETETSQDVLSLYTQLSAQGVVEAVEPASNVKQNRAAEKISAVSSPYIRNPDVVLREEDEGGGLLINPNTNQVRALNNTGLFIWQQCDGTCNLVEITTAVQEAFDEVPVEQVAQDVREFVDEMMESGFIGTVEDVGEGN